MTFTVLSTALDALRQVTAVAVHTGRLDGPTPCSDWTVAQVLLHAAGDQHVWASTVGAGPPPSYDPFDPPRQLDGGVQDAVTRAIEAAGGAWAGVDPTAPSVHTPLPPVPEMTPALAAAACALDAAVHAWDVAVSTGQPTPLTVALAERLAPAAHATAEPLRGFAYAPALAAQAGDDPVAALLRHLGRDPHWTADGI
ncbi:maleylpyruvate isomerase N-terminal domain-containing protein [Micromonospora sp. WMMD1102]|uniref:maleylpyruvate isomerase N-terminal domain-containing protein n=1 Tax=Micromonospora sp. WMMD1102 TaxID=3016105 RepID=UPI002414E6B7|nr:maleylpyruvate isomerase N-terminal domain-containing protein [Micromonospora sp. WMMD1102]MDG4787771.1 maleylpyruvate isomerase N-terminal domain-containing protein [Micromonospora sp. WMMD1102]